MNDNKCRNCGKDIVVAIFKGGDWCSDNCRKVLEHGAVKTAVITRTFANEQEEMAWALELVRYHSELTNAEEIVQVFSFKTKQQGSRRCFTWAQSQQELEDWVQTASEANPDYIFFFEESNA